MIPHVEFGQHEWSYGPAVGEPSLWCKLFGHRWWPFTPAQEQIQNNMTRLIRSCRRKSCKAEQAGWRA